MSESTNTTDGITEAARAIGTVAREAAAELTRLRQHNDALRAELNQSRRWLWCNRIPDGAYDIYPVGSRYEVGMCTGFTHDARRDAINAYGDARARVDELGAMDGGGS